ncbi:Fe-S cluster assembly protein SufE [Arsukibacterium ikkense]|uniref:Fe-S cluster assembly protein SufE n=1 Tax=Arsukibacterium ikkense TaxID=336831 RepID=A0A0M2V2V3_9GAMM|nr:SufE family protein [Arsukibacterium ikkense]KKO44971.1 Fe-S cluster assembly protein SufE [Arsukibacterium ikkense]
MTLPGYAQIIEDIAFFDDWEQRYQYIIDLGKSIPPLAAEHKTAAHLVAGCQSKVWLTSQQQGGRLQFQADSDAVIVNGLLAVVLAAYHNQTPAAILAFAIDDYFKTLDLERHISPLRGNGLRAIVARIISMAKRAQSEISQ